MPELIALHQIVTREKKGGPRIIIPANSRFDPTKYPMISDREWHAMMTGSPQIIRHPDDPAYAVPPVAAQRAAAGEPVQEGRSPRLDVGKNAPAVAKDGITVPRNPDDGGEAEAVKQAAAEDDAERQARVEAAAAAREKPANGRRGRRAAAPPPADDDDDDDDDEV